MVSIFHVPAFIPAFILFFFAALIPQGFAQGKTPCETCIAVDTNAWCIKDYGVEKARNCIAKDLPEACLGGTMPTVCPAAPVTPTTHTTRVADVDSCDACKDKGGKWCIKVLGSSLIKECFTEVKPGTLCAGPLETAYTDCPSVVDANRLSADEADIFTSRGAGNSCNDCKDGAPSNKWCIKDYKNHKTKYCAGEIGVRLKTACLGGQTVECAVATQQGDNTGQANVETCAECQLLGHKWCIKSNEFRGCFSAAMVAVDCAQTRDSSNGVCDAADLKSTTTGKVTAGEAAATCTACVNVAANSWCIKGYGDPKVAFCVITANQDTACMGGTTTRVCTPPDDRQTAADKKTCGECEKIGKWCMKGTGSTQIEACIPKTDTTSCTGGQVIPCSELKGIESMAATTTKAPTTNTTKPNRASILGVSAVPVLTVLGAITLLG